MTIEIINTFDEIRKSYNGSSCRTERSKIGQFLTPLNIARYMASLFRHERDHVRLLDAGAGTGVLFATYIETLVTIKKPPTSIYVVAYENDQRILPYLEETMKRCELVCKSAGIEFRGEIRVEDFITAALSLSEENLFYKQDEKFTHGILNPPYKKINGRSLTRRLLNKAGIEVSNLYAAFVWLSARLIVSGGELVAITPRSFCNGPYFRRFRTELLKMMRLHHIHIFDSRKKAFADDDVLQENVIYYMVKEERRPERLIISSSEGSDFDKSINRLVLYDTVVSPKDRDAFIHLVLSEADNHIMNKVETFATSLSELGIDVSTGRVVDFRAQRYLRLIPEKEAVPLIYPCHFISGFVSWPSDSVKKPNAIVALPQTKELLLPSGYYVLTKRFTTKEERRRVVAAIFDPKRVRSTFVGFENHMNYFHIGGKGLSPKLAKGLALYLNSSIVDRYFRLFSGHTQVNATDLRRMPYPSIKQLFRLGTYVKHQMPDQATVDEILEKECAAHDE
ncbi:MAG: SAM-dependent methyltransferase [Nitrospiraceae bacterium]|nr:MAG: SAM-dependent methyltransferase [Nitrospiraceae bacterium]